MRRIAKFSGLLPLALSVCLMPARADDAAPADGQAGGAQADQTQAQDSHDAQKKAEVHKTVTGPRGGTAKKDATWTKDGNTVTHQETTTGPKGGTTTRSSTTTRSGNTVSRQGTTTLPNGKTVTSQDTWTKDGNTVTRQGTTTGPNGGVSQRQITTTKDGNTVTREATRTGPDGRTITTTSTTTVPPDGQGPVKRKPRRPRPIKH